MDSKIKIDVKRPTIHMLVDEIRSGKYYLPSFQRQYVWDEDDIKDLIDSIVKNYPIGTIILWKPSTALISKIDPFSKPLVGKSQIDHKEIFYVIDGQQRLTSLLLLFNNWEIERGNDKITCDPVSYNPANQKFYKSTKKGIDLSKLIKAFYQYDEASISELKKRTSDESYQAMKTMIINILNDYPVPICIMESDREDEKTFSDMAEAFIRVNKYGIRIGNLELMLSFLAGAISGDLKDKIRSIYEELYQEFEIDLQPVIRFSFSNFGLKQTQISKVEQFKRNIEKISNYKSEETAQIFSQCSRAMKLTIELLKVRLGLNNSALLPSQTPLIPISRYFFIKGIESLDELDDTDANNIINWFVLASFNGYYSSQTDTKLDRDLECINNSHFPSDILFNNMRERNARTKITLDDIKKGLELNVLRLQGRSHLFMLYLLLVRSNADDWNGCLLSQASIGNIAKHHIFPKEFLEQNLEIEEPDSKENVINNLANITFIHKDINSEIEDEPPEKYLNDYREPAKKHFIPTDQDLWSINQYTTFLQYRIKQIYNKGKEFFRDIFE